MSFVPFAICRTEGRWHGRGAVAPRNKGPVERVRGLAADWRRDQQACWQEEVKRMIFRQPRGAAIAIAFGAMLAGCPIVVAQSPVPLGRDALPTNVIPERYDIEVTPNSKELTFAGKVTIAINVQSASDRIILNAADLEIGRVALSDVAEVPKVILDEKKQTVAITFERPITPGRRKLSILYSGKIKRQISGFFATDYDTPQGPRRDLFTQFGNADARRFLPSWDEPARKAVFSLTVVAPKGEMAISNMPIAETTDLDSAHVKVRFADSPVMSSYLLFLALGDFQRITTQVGGVEIGVVTGRGDTSAAQFALDAAAKLVGYYNEYFDTPYPLPKLDLVASPGQSQSFDAMENWGAIRCSDAYLLLDPKLSTERDKQLVFIVIAHEISHQWFGDLVTMAWWDDLWLNEGFASWMENKATDHFHPEWKVWLDAASLQEAAMVTDARSGTHPVITPIRDVLEAAGAFDTITYQKGQAVVRMLEAYVGETAFRAGVRSYIKKNVYKNAVSDDLWAEIDAASSLPVADIAHDFTLQSGVPLIRVEEQANSLALSQVQFATENPAPKPRTWITPVVVRAGSTSWRGTVRGDRPTYVVDAFSTGAIVNAGHAGYFRTDYEPTLWASLTQQFATLVPEDQLGLIYDSYALGEDGLSPFSNFLEIADRADAGVEPLVWGVLTQKLSDIDVNYEGMPGRQAFRSFARRRLKPVLALLSWEARDGESDNEAVLRTSVLSALGDLDDAAVIEEARRRFSAYLTDPNTLSGSTWQTVLNIVASRAVATTWNQIHELAKASPIPGEKAVLYGLLGSSHDPSLAEKALALALEDEAPATVRPTIIAAVGEIFPDLAFDFAVAHRSAIEAMLEPNSRWTYFARTASHSRNVATAEKLATFSETYVPETARNDVVKAVAAIRYRAKVIETRLPEIDRWIAAHPA
jgi:aminopeptidase N